MMGRPQVMVAGRAPDDGNGALVLAAGLVAALAGGFGWAAIVIFTNYEIGWAAWGVGVVVGLAMMRVTHARSQSLGVMAGVLAALGLLLGKVFIVVGSVGPMADDLMTNDQWLAAHVAWQMYDQGSLRAETRAELDATLTAGDTLSDSIWADMMAQATATLRGLSEAEREEAAMAAARATTARIGMLGGVMAQLSLFDLLWVGLAVATAFGMMARHAQAEASEEVEDSPPLRVAG